MSHPMTQQHNIMRFLKVLQCHVIVKVDIHVTVNVTYNLEFLHILQNILYWLCSDDYMEIRLFIFLWGEM